MTRPTFPTIAASVAPLPAPKPMQTYAQRRITSNAEAMLLDAMSGVRAEDMPNLIATALVARFGAAAAERIGERIGTLAHMQGRV